MAHDPWSARPSTKYWFKDGVMVCLCAACRIRPALNEYRDADGTAYCEECHEALTAKWETDNPEQES